MSTRFRLPTLSALALVLVAAACESPTDPITVRVKNATLEAVGDARQLEATVANSDRLPEWESLNPEIVTVTRAGMAVAVAPGTARVRAKVGSVVSEGNVTVMPRVEVQLTSLTLVTEPSGQPGTRMQLRNVGGRGFFRLEYWQARESAGGEHRRVASWMNDFEAPAGMDVSFNTAGIAVPDWVVIYSREPNSTEYRLTGCLRMDGGTPCPMP